MKNKNISTNAAGKINLLPKVSVQGKEIYPHTKGQTLLECLEAEDVQVDYHCRDGFCGACRVILVSGEVYYPQGEPLAFVAKNEILTCCCVPVTDVQLKLDK